MKLIAFAATAPTMLNTSSMSSTAIATPIATAYKMNVNK